jgi:hypothetical protein
MIVQSARFDRVGRMSRDRVVQPRHDQFLVAIVDHRRLRLVSTKARQVAEVETLNEPLPRNVETSTGRSRADRHYEELTRMHFRHASADIAEVAAQHPEASIVVAGPDDSVAELVSELDDATNVRVVGRVSLAMTASVLDIIDSLGPVRRDLEQRYTSDLIDRLTNGGTPARPAVVGLSATLESLADGSVGHLVVSTQCASGGARCPSCSHLDVAVGPCGRCGTQQIAVDDVIARAIDRAIHLDATIDIVEIDASSTFVGIGAIERF